MPNNPVQIVLNTRDYFVSPEAGSFGPAKDFFQDRDPEFVEHRNKLERQVMAISEAFQQSSITDGIVKVSLRREAWAKSSRPQRALFPPEKRPCIGVSTIGELYYHVTSADISEIHKEIASAEDETRRRTSAKSGKEYVSPSNQRSDVGAVDSIEIPDSSEKRSFSLADGIRWLTDPRTSGAYFIEFFMPPPTFLTRLVEDFIGRLVSQITTNAESQGVKVEVFTVDVAGLVGARPTSVVAFRLIPIPTRVDLFAQADHAKFLSIVDAHPYVRRVLLPPIVPAATEDGSTAEGDETLPAKQTGFVYPRVGIIDGGISASLSSWSVGTHTIVAPEHVQTDHGSFIGGLLIGAGSLNGTSVCGEPDGCELFDIGILPDTGQAKAFETYYPNGIVDFIDELSAGVEIAKRDHGIRIFNMSLNLFDPVQGDTYGIVANLLDRVADKHDVLFVLSAGNLKASECRPEWPADVQAAMQLLASRTSPDTILQPAESSRSIAVGALNAPGCVGRVDGAPASYTRRGPGLRVGVKPDMAHVGGSTPDGRTGSGLRSWNSAGQVITGHGTSYAAPLVAKSFATLDSRVSSPLTREMLIAMLIHGCKTPSALADEALSEVARQFAGFGVPQCSEEMLQTPDHEITLVFSDVLRLKTDLQFDFVWPRSLVNPVTGACRGEVHMTLVYRPPLNRDFGSEFVRVNLDAYLRQEQGDKYVNRIRQGFLATDGDAEGHFEHELIQHGLKWWPVKSYREKFPNGKGKSSNWRLSLESLTRAEEAFPTAGVPFSLVLTISDIKMAAPVFTDLRLHLTTRNVQIADIRTSTQVRV